eukprot:3152759-Pleurochrysis_carterae.AAC.3
MRRSGWLDPSRRDPKQRVADIPLWQRLQATCVAACVSALAVVIIIHAALFSREAIVATTISVVAAIVAIPTATANATTSPTAAAAAAVAVAVAATAAG